ncbi:MAG: MFS transporter [Firmicutes bacterium]|nr:MFS transporter [Bacillota bacterium]
MTQMISLFTSLRHREYRLFWSGQCISLIGTWMQNVAQDWLVLQLTNSSFKLGLLVAAKFTPMAFLPLLAGVTVEHHPKRNILLLTQSGLMLQAVVLTLLTWFKVVRYEHVLLMMLLWGIINSFDMTTRQAYVIELAGREDVKNAIALNSAVLNLARLLGPALAGLTMMRFGAAVCFGLNALSFLAVLVGLLMIPPGKVEKKKTSPAVGREIREGLAYVYREAALREPLLLLALLSLFAENFSVLIPTFAKFTLAGNARVLGYLWSALGLGALFAALALAATSGRPPARRSLLAIGLGLCMSEFFVATVRSLPLAVAGLCLGGFAMTGFNALVNTSLQLATEDRYRGRVMSLYSLILAGLTPLGSIFTGSVAHLLGPPGAFVAGATIGLMGIGLLAALQTREKTRPPWNGHSSASDRKDELFFPEETAGTTGVPRP